MTRFVDWRRALLLLPILVGVAVGLYVLLSRDSASATPRAHLLETTARDGVSVGTKKGQIARNFEARSPDGEIVRLSDLRGTPTIINFWATWCSSCVVELPDLRDLQAELGPERLKIVAVNVGEGSGAARKFLNSLDAPDIHAGMDPTLVVADAYGVRGMPQSIFIDGEGIIRAVYVGQLKPDVMRQYVQSASRGADQPNDQSGPLRIITTVARDRVLEVNELDTGRVEFRSKSLRCDDAYCAASVVDALAATAGVLSIERHLDLDPALIVVELDARETSVEPLANLLASELGQYADPLYTRPLELQYR